MDYIDNKCIPGGTFRNWESYGNKIGNITEYQKIVLADPQTSGGLLVAIDPESEDEVKNIFIKYGLGNFTETIGKIVSKGTELINIKM